MNHTDRLLVLKKLVLLLAIATFCERVWGNFPGLTGSEAVRFEQDAALAPPTSSVTSTATCIAGITIKECEAAKVAAQACEKAKALASSACLESLSPQLANGVSAINALMSGADMMGVTKVCSKYKKAMDLANTAMTAYSATCGYLKKSCDTTCMKASQALVQANTAIASAASKGASVLGSQELIWLDSDMATVQTMQKENTLSQTICTGYKLQLAAAAMGGAALMKKFMTAQKCEEDSSTVNCAATPNDPRCAVAAVDCTKPENNTKIECICLKNPRNAGCGGDNTASGNGVMASSQGASTRASGAVLPDPNLSVNQDLNPSFKAGDIPGSGAGGSASGGSAPGGASGGGGKGADSAKSGVMTKTGLNPNILTGDSGGGGGGGGWRGGGGGSSDSDNYKAYLPGGAKDPTRAVASPATSAPDVTGSGGADNWTKVTNRYRDKKPTLMGE